MPDDLAFGLALENFTPSSISPTFEAVANYSRRAEELGFQSLWAWDHILLGSKKPFPFLESLSLLAGLGAITDRIRLGTGILVLPLRNPVVLAKVTSTIDLMTGGRLDLGVATGWYKKEFEACGIPFGERGRIFERNLDVLKRFWVEESVKGAVDDMEFNGAVMLPKSARTPSVLIGGYVDKVLQRVARRSDGWLTYFYMPKDFEVAWQKIGDFAERAGRDPAELGNVAQLPICISDSFEESDRRVRGFIDRYFDVAPWSLSSADSALRGTPEQCAEQLQEHIDAGVRHVVFVPCDYDLDQVEGIASDLLPALGIRAEAVSRR